MVFNAIVNNISVISWLSVLLVKETGVIREKAGDIKILSNKMNCNLKYFYTKIQS